MILTNSCIAISGPPHLKLEPYQWKANDNNLHLGIPNKMAFNWVEFTPY